MSLFKKSPPKKTVSPKRTHTHTHKKFDTLSPYIKRKGVEVSLWKELLLISSFLLEKKGSTLLVFFFFSPSAFEEYYSLSSSHYLCVVQARSANH